MLQEGNFTKHLDTLLVTYVYPNYLGGKGWLNKCINISYLFPLLFPCKKLVSQPVAFAFKVHFNFTCFIFYRATDPSQDSVTSAYDQRSIWINISGTREMYQRIRVLAALWRELSLVPTPTPRGLTTSCNYNSMGLWCLLASAKHPHTRGIQTHSSKQNSTSTTSIYLSWPMLHKSLNILLHHRCLCYTSSQPFALENLSQVPFILGALFREDCHPRKNGGSPWSSEMTHLCPATGSF